MYTHYICMLCLLLLCGKVLVPLSQLFCVKIFMLTVTKQHSFYSLCDNVAGSGTHEQVDSVSVCP